MFSVIMQQKNKSVSKKKNVQVAVRIRLFSTFLFYSISVFILHNAIERDLLFNGN